MLGLVTTAPREEWAERLPLWRNGEHAFTPGGLTVLFGPNACGKSTLLNAIAQWCFIDEWSGVQQPIKPSKTRMSEPYESYQTPYEEYRCSPPGLTIDAEWGGSHTAYVGKRLLGRVAYDMDDVFRRPGGFDLWKKSTKLSEGENAVLMVREVIKQLQARPAIERQEVDEEDKYVSWRANDIHFNQFVPTTTPRPLLLMDEPDRSLSLLDQFKLYEMLRGVVADDNFQVVVASHSPAALALADTVVSFDDRYLQDFKVMWGKLTTLLGE